MIISNSTDILDATGYRCPMPVIKLEAALRRMKAGQLLTIFADDPVAAVDIPHFYSLGGHRAERLPNQGKSTKICVFRVTCRGNVAN